MKSLAKRMVKLSDEVLMIGQMKDIPSSDSKTNESEVDGELPFFTLKVYSPPLETSINAGSSNCTSNASTIFSSLLLQALY